MIAAGSSTDYRPLLIANIILSGGDRSIPFFFFSIRFTLRALLRYSSALISSPRAWTTWSPVWSTRYSMRSTNSPCRAIYRRRRGRREDERKRGGWAEERVRGGSLPARFVYTRRCFVSHVCRCVYGLRIDAPKEQNGAHVYARKRMDIIQRKRERWTHQCEKATHRVIYISCTSYIAYTPSPNKGNEEKPRWRYGWRATAKSNREIYINRYKR